MFYHIIFHSKIISRNLFPYLQNAWKCQPMPFRVLLFIKNLREPYTRLPYAYKANWTPKKPLGCLQKFQNLPQTKFHQILASRPNSNLTNSKTFPKLSGQWSPSQPSVWPEGSHKCYASTWPLLTLSLNLCTLNQDVPSLPPALYFHLGQHHTHATVPILDTSNWK
jgi:hypothetical protein